MALASASTEARPEPRSTSQAAPSQAGERADDRPAEEAETASPGSAASEGSAVDGGAGSRWQGVADPAAAGSSAAAAAPSGTDLTGTTVSAAVESSSDGYLRQSAVEFSAGEAVPQSSAMGGADVPAAMNSTTRVSGKQDRPKAQPETKNTGTQTTAVVTVADQSRPAIVNMVSWQGAGFGPGSEAQGSEVQSNSAKSASAGNAAGAHTKMATPLDGTASGPTSSTIVSSAAAGAEQGALIQTPEEVFQAGQNLSMTPGLPGSAGWTIPADAGLPAADTVLKSGTSSVDAGISKATAGASSSKGTGAGVADSSWHAANDGQAAQNAAGDTGKAGAAVMDSKAIENGPAQGSMQTLLTPAVSHGAANPQHAAAATPDGARTGKAQDTAASAHVAGEEAVASSGINSARVIQTMGETEMHVGMHSAEFGDISIRTSVSAQQMVTQISLDHNDLSQAISTHLSSVQAKLGEEYGLHASIEINNQGAPLSGGQGEGSQREQQAFGRSSQGKPIVPASAGESVAGVVALSGAGSGHGLDITV